MASLFTRFIQFNSSQQIHSDGADPQQQPSSNITTELKDLRKFSLNSLLAFLAILAAPKALQPAVLTLLLYTNSLRLSDTCFLYNHLTLSRVLRVVPLLVVSCMTCVQLVSAVQSPAIVVVALLLGSLPLVTVAIRFGGQVIGIVTEASAPALPVWMHHVVESGQANGN